jgi:hypothetical protein
MAEVHIGLRGNSLLGRIASSAVPRDRSIERRHDRG